MGRCLRVVSTLLIPFSYPFMPTDSVSLTTRPTLDLQTLSDEDRAVLQAARQANSRPQVMSYDSIKLKDSEKKVLDINGKALPRGGYYIESYDPQKKEKAYQAIGMKPEVVILHQCFTYSWYKEGEGLMAWTNDIQALDDTGYVTLYSKRSGQVKIEFQGRYKPDFKNFIDQKYTARGVDGSTEKLLKFQTLLYVLFEGKVYRMFVTNASAAGIPKGQKAPDFRDPQAGSLKLFVEGTRGRDMDGALCEFVCKLGATFRDDMEQPFYIRTFENVGPNEKLPIALGELRKIKMTVAKADKDAQERLSVEALRQETVTVQGMETIDVPVIDYDQNRPDITTLPF